MPDGAAAPAPGTGAPYAAVAAGAGCRSSRRGSLASGPGPVPAECAGPYRRAAAASPMTDWCVHTATAVAPEEFAACPCSTTSSPASGPTSRAGRRATSEADLRAALADVDPPRDPMPRLRAPGLQRDRRGEAAQPQQGRPRRDPRPGRARPALRRRRGRRDQRAHRGAPVRRAASTTCARSAPPSTPRCCARTSSSSPTRCSRRGPPAPTWSC